VVISGYLVLACAQESFPTTKLYKSPKDMEGEVPDDCGDDPNEIYLFARKEAQRKKVKMEL
jgi:hypothetical protein